MHWHPYTAVSAVIAVIVIAAGLTGRLDVDDRRRVVRAGAVIAVWALAATVLGRDSFVFSPILIVVPIAALGYTALSMWERIARDAPATPGTRRCQDCAREYPASISGSCPDCDGSIVAVPVG